MRFVCGDVRDLIVSHKTDHGPAHRRHRALQQWSRLKSAFARFSASFDFRLLQQYRPIAAPDATARPQLAKADTAFRARPLVNRLNLA
jgi:hypothetical protein